MQVGSARPRGPLPADHGREPTRIVVGVCHLCILLPGIARHNIRIGYWAAHFFRRPGGFHGATAILNERRCQPKQIKFLQRLAQAILDEPTFHGVEKAEAVARNTGLGYCLQRPHEFSVIGNNKKIQGCVNLHSRLIVRVNDGLTLGITVGGCGIHRTIESQIGIKRIGTVNVSVPPIECTVLSDDWAGSYC